MFFVQAFRALIVFFGVCCLIASKDVSAVDNSPWHMIIGGYWTIEEGVYLTYSSVELHNWKTGEQCYLDNLPIAGVVSPTGSFFNGSSITCGGFMFTGEKVLNCFKLQKEQKVWEKTLNLLSDASFAESVLVPNSGWFIFGGSDSTQTKAQMLKSLAGDWELGPDVFQSKYNGGECVVQVNDTMTAFLGGFNNPFDIVTLDWSSMVYTKQNSQFNGKRVLSSCAILNGINGETLVVVAGGNTPESRGMEAWNPADGSVQILSEVLPPEEGKFSGLETSQLVSINGGSDLLLFGGWAFNAYAEGGIWKFSTAGKTWTRLGDMLAQRAAHFVINTDIEC